MFSISTKCFLIPISFFPTNAMSSAYANMFHYSLPIFILLGTIFILCITFCNAKLNSIGYKGSPCFKPGLFSKKDDNVPSILTALLVFCKHVLDIFINLVGILNSFIHSHGLSLCIVICKYKIQPQRRFWHKRIRETRCRHNPTNFLCNRGDKKSNA